MSSSDTCFVSLLWVRAVLRPILQTDVLCRAAAPAGGASLRWEGELQGLSIFGRSGFARPVAVGDHQPAVFLSGAGRVAVGLVGPRRVIAWVAGVVVLKVGQVPGGDAAALDVRRLAVGVAVFLVDVLPQLPPLPLFQHLGLNLRGDWSGEAQGSTDDTEHFR